MLDRNSQKSFDFIIRRIKGKFTAPQSSDLLIASDCIVVSSLRCPYSLVINRFHIRERYAFRPIDMYITKIFKDPLVPLRPFGRSLLEVVG